MRHVSGSVPPRRALVTGASSGIGAAFAARLADDGYHLILVARSRNRLETLAKRLRNHAGVDVTVWPADLTDPEQLRAIEKRITKPGTHLDLLVNNAGVGTIGRFVDLDAEGEEAEIRLNVIALVRLARAALPAMIARRRGAIINVSSLAAFQPSPRNATYGATKAFVNSFTEALYEEIRGTGVSVQALCPGFTRTEFQERAGVDTSSVPSFIWMTPEAVVEASLAALQRGTLICIPGFAYRAMATLTSTLPRSVVRRASGFIMERAGSNSR